MIALTRARVRSIAIALVIAGAASRVVAEEDPRIRAYEQQLERMQHEMDELRARLRVLEEERGMRPAPATGAADLLAREPSAGALFSEGRGAGRRLTIVGRPPRDWTVIEGERAVAGL